MRAMAASLGEIIVESEQGRQALLMEVVEDAQDAQDAKTEEEVVLEHPVRTMTGIAVVGRGGHGKLLG